MKKAGLLVALILVFSVVSFAQGDNLIIDDFETPIIKGLDGTIDYGSGNGSSVEVSSEPKIKYSKDSSLKVVYNAVAGGYMWIARGFDLDAQNAGWLVDPQDIIWDDYSALAFYMYGSDSKNRIAVDVKDSGNEVWRFIINDDFNGWREVVCPFEQFAVRDDWQPESSDKNSIINFPLKSYQFEPLPESSGTLYFDRVELIKK
ncbi:MAG: Carbohydrate binding domain (family 11) [Candidatus Omnitrophica bacterium ADurb.Bin205]|nr:MAG: Carbohydrate binding domain (family 11) [Candidatus Omnitrophica bacterium ADurb.Bin205]